MPSDPINFGSCPKCGHDDIGVKYEDDNNAWSCFRDRHPSGEHFDLNCRTCHYEWTKGADDAE